MFSKIKLNLMLLSGVILLNSCAITNYTIERNYNPQLSQLDSAKNYSIATKVNYTPVFLNDVKAVGVKKGGYGNETARIYMNDEVEKWILNSFQAELLKAGYLVNDKNAKNNIEVVLNVNQLFVEPWVGVWTCTLYGILSIDVKVQIPGDKVSYRRKFVTYDEQTTIIWPDGMFEDRIINVSEKLLPKVIKEINILLANKNGGNR